MYTIFFHQEAKKHLTKFTQSYKNRIGKALTILRSDPQKNTLNIKKLTSSKNNLYRIRLGELRIIYELNTNNRTIIVRDIDYRGNIY